MKKVKDFMVMPLTQVLVIAIGLIVSFTGSGFINIPIGIIIYIAAGWLFSKIDNKKVKIISAVISALLVAAICIAILISAEFSNSDDFYMLLFISPFALPATYIVHFIIPDYLTASYILTRLIITLLCSVCPIFVTALSAKFFDIKNKRIKEQ